VRTLCVVPCGKTKIWDKHPGAGPTVAKEVYLGPFAKKCREYAERFHPSSWCILSAKYGFLFPDDEVPRPYNVSFNDRKTNPIKVEDLWAQATKKGLNVHEEIVVLGGRIYTHMVKEVFPKADIFAPLSHCGGIGYMMKELKEAINRGSPL